MAEEPRNLSEPASDADGFDSQAQRVVFFEDRAEVTRRATVNAVAGANTILIKGISLFADERSLRARVLSDDAEVKAARLVHEVEWDNDVEEGEEALEDARDRAAVAVQEARSNLARNRGQLEGTARFLAEWAAALAEQPAIALEQVDQWRAAFDVLKTAQDAALVMVSAGSVLLEERTEQRVQAEARYELGRRREPVLKARAALQFEVQTDGPVEVELTYRTPVAVWRPEHLARLRQDEDDPTRGTIELVTWATVWQRCGEDWRDVEAVFSTARPAQASSPPLLEEDALWARKKTAQERQSIDVTIREESIDEARTGSPRPASQMPGVDDGGEPLTFTANELVTLLSNGLPTRVEIQRTQLEATISRVLVPERAPVAHYRARATLCRPEPLLAGPVRVAREESFVGAARVDFVAVGDQLEMGFGIDDAVQVTREVDTERDQTAITGTQHISRVVRLYVSNLSGDERTVEIRERIPVSEIEAVEIDFKPPRGWRFAAKDGFADYTLALGSSAHEKLELSYEMRAGSKVNLPF